MSIEQRLSALEHDLTELKQELFTAETIDIQPDNSMKAQLPKKSAPERVIQSSNTAGIYRARWDGEDSTGYTRAVRISGENFCTDGDREDVCCYAIDIRGTEKPVEFARSIRLIRGNTIINANLPYGNSFAHVWVAVRSSNCGDSWSEWELIEER